MEQITYQKGDVIFRQGEIAECMYDIVSGKVGIYKDYRTEQEEKIAELSAGQIFGEMGMIELYPRSATAVALEDGLVLNCLGEANLEAYFKDEPEKVLQLMRQLSGRLRETTQKYLEVCGAVRRDKSTEEKGEISNELNRYANFYRDHWGKP